MLKIAFRIFLPLLLFPLTLTAFGAKPQTESTVLHYVQPANINNYYTKVLNLALSYSQEQKPQIILKPFTPNSSRMRLVFNVLNSDDAYLVTYSHHPEITNTGLYQIKPPIMAGLLGMRLILVRRNNIKKLRELRSAGRFKQDALAGFSRHWLDFGLLEKNGFKLSSATKHLNLLKMLIHQRVDYLPRGLPEIFWELRALKVPYPDVVLWPEQTLYYPLPVHFYINPKHQDIGERIEYGLRQAMADGRFKQLFTEHYSAEIKWLKTQDFDTLLLSNPYINAQQIPKNQDWWQPPRLQAKIKAAKPPLSL